jgi:hypothetical protein
MFSADSTAARNAGKAIAEKSGVQMPQVEARQQRNQVSAVKPWLKVARTAAFFTSSYVTCPSDNGQAFLLEAAQ